MGEMGKIKTLWVPGKQYLYAVLFKETPSPYIKVDQLMSAHREVLLGSQMF